MHKLARFVKHSSGQLKLLYLAKIISPVFKKVKMNKASYKCKCTCYTLVQAHLSCENEKWILTLFDVKKGF